MTKPQLIASAVVGWVAIHGGLILLGGVLGVGLSIPFLPHSTNSPTEAEIGTRTSIAYDNGFSAGSTLHCEEDEVAIHGGISDWYDPDLPLECVAFDEFPEVYGGAQQQAYNDGFDDGAGFDWEQFRAETYRDGFGEGYNEGLSDAANTEVGEAWSKRPAPDAPLEGATPVPP